MADGDEAVQGVTKDGAQIKIKLSEWAEMLIDRALAKHSTRCPIEEYREQRQKQIGSLEKRIEILELKLRIIQWITTPMYITIVGWIVYKILT